MIIKGINISVTTEEQDFTGSLTFNLNHVPLGSFTSEDATTDNFTIYQGVKESDGRGTFNRRASNNTFADNVFVRSTKSSRDVEVGYNTATYLVLRDNGVSGILCNITNHGSGAIEVEISRADMQISEFYLNHYNWIIYSADVSSLIDAVGAGDGTGYVFGAVGVEVYLKYNGVKILTAYNYDILHTGVVSVVNNRAEYGGYVYPFTVNHLERISLYSDTDEGVLDVRDFGLIADLKTTGSMNISDPYKLILNEETSSDFTERIVVGTSLVIAVGGEAPFNGRSNQTLGIVAVGGVSVPLHFPSLEAMAAETSLPHDTRSWLETTGETYKWWPADGVWYRVMYTDTVGQQINEYNNWTTGTARGKRLIATVVSIDGDELTLNVPCQATTTNADVWIDASPILENLCTGAESGSVNLPMGGIKHVVLPAGDFVLSRPLYLTGGRDGWSIEGQPDLTRFIAVKGAVKQPEILMVAIDDATIKNLVMIGNYEDEDWGSDFRSGGVKGGNGNNLTISGIKFYKYGWHVLGYEQVTNSIIEDCYSEWVKDAHGYYGWPVGANSGTVNCIIRNNYFWNKVVRMPMCEAYGSNYNKFYGNTLRNGWFASNSGVNMEIKGNTIVLEAGTLPANQNPSQPVININGNNDYGTGSGGIVEDNDIEIWGGDAKKNLQRAIVIQDGINGTLVKNNRIEYKEVAESDATYRYPVGIFLGSNNNTVEDNTVVTLVGNNPPAGLTGNNYTIGVNGIYQVSSDPEIYERTYGNKIYRNTCYAIDCPMDDIDYCDTPLPPDENANDVTMIHSGYEQVWP